MIKGRLSNREKIIILIGSGIISTTLLYQYIISPLINKWEELDKKIYVKELKLRSAKNLISTFNLQEYHEIRQRFYTIKTQDAINKYLPEIFKELDDIAYHSKVIIIGTTPTYPESTINERYTFIFINLNICGKLKEIVEFLYRIENLKLVMHIREFEINIDESEANKLNAELLIGIPFIYQ